MRDIFGHDPQLTIGFARRRMTCVKFRVATQKKIPPSQSGTATTEPSPFSALSCCVSASCSARGTPRRGVTTYGAVVCAGADDDEDDDEEVEVDSFVVVVGELQPGPTKPGVGMLFGPNVRVGKQGGGGMIPPPGKNGGIGMTFINDCFSIISLFLHGIAQR